MKIVRTGENEYRIGGLDRSTLKDMVGALQVYVAKGHKKGYYGYTFDRVIEMIGTKNLERMKIKRTSA